MVHYFTVSAERAAGANRPMYHVFGLGPRFWDLGFDLGLVVGRAINLDNVSYKFIGKVLK